MKGGKHPRVRWSPEHLPAQTHVPIPQGDNVGLATGFRSGIFVLDLDNKHGKNGFASFNQLRNGKPLPTTFMVKTPSGGAHLYFTIPPNTHIPKLNNGELGPGIDLCGEGAYVVMPPSRAPNGKGEIATYDILNNAPPATPPDWLLALIADAKPSRDLPADYTRARPHTHNPEALEVGRVDFEAALTRIWSLPHGTRNSGLFNECCKVGRIIALGRLDPHAAEKQITARVAGWDEQEKTLATMQRGLQTGYEEAVVLLEYARLPHTDMGNAQRLIRRAGDDLLYAPLWKQWLKWDKRSWIRDNKLVTQELAKQTVAAIKIEATLFEGESDLDSVKRKEKALWAHQSQNGTRVREMVNLASSQVPIEPTDLDSDPFLFNVQNGTIDLRTGKLGPHKRDDLISKISPCAYTPQASSNLWQKCLDMWTAKDRELQEYLQRMAGYFMTGVQTEKAFFFIYGPPDAGKNKFLQALLYVLGDYAAYADAETWLRSRFNSRGNREDLASLLGARVAYTDELPKQRAFDEVWLKRVTGGGDITCAGKYEKQITYTPQFKIIMSANDAPEIRADDHGMWNRCKRIPFSFPVPKKMQIKDLSEQLQKEADAILAWCVKGCRHWLADGLGTCQAIQWSTDEYRRDNSTLERFLEEETTTGEDAWVYKKVIYDAYVRWLHSNNARNKDVVTIEAFTKELRHYHPELTEGRKSNQRYWRGIALQDPTNNADYDKPAPKPKPKELTDNVIPFPLKEYYQ